MAQYTTIFLGIYSVVVNAAARIMFYLSLTPCGMETEIDGENNIVRNAQKIDILSPTLAINGRNSCDVWNSYGFELFEYLILSFLMIALVYWGLTKIFKRQGLLDRMQKRKEEAKTTKLQRMKDSLAKQRIMVTEAIDIEEKIPEIVLKPLQG